MSPADLGPEELRAYLTHLVEQRISFSYFNMIVAALRFLYTVTLERDWAVPRLPYQKQERRLPAVLSPEEVRRFLDAVPDLKMRTMLITAYAAGLRVFEVVALRPGDIDSQRMVLRVAQGKGRKDRLRHALAPAARGAARLLEGRAADGRVAVSRPGSRPAHQHPRGPARLPDGAARRPGSAST